MFTKFLFLIGVFSTAVLEWAIFKMKSPECVSSLEKLCSTRYLGCDSFVICLGFIGTIFTISDVFRVIQGGRTLSDDMWGRRSSRNGIVDSQVERDLKLISSILGVEHYVFLIIGALYGKPIFLVPWLVLQAFVIFMEIVIFFAKLICDGVQLFRGEVIVNALLFHNWMQVLCFYKNMS